MVAVEKRPGDRGFGGQTPLSLAHGLEKNGAPIIGTSPDMIDCAEDRARFQQMLHQLKLNSCSIALHAISDRGCGRNRLSAGDATVQCGPGGRAMKPSMEQADVQCYTATRRKCPKPIPSACQLLDRFLHDALEVDVDAQIRRQGVMIGGIMEHVQQAGVHSGPTGTFRCHPSACQTDQPTAPPGATLKVAGVRAVRRQGETVYVLEANRCASLIQGPPACRSAKIAARCMLGMSLAKQGITSEWSLRFTRSRSWFSRSSKFPGVDIILGPEMNDLMGVGDTFAEAFVKSQLVGQREAAERW